MAEVVLVKKKATSQRKVRVYQNSDSESDGDASEDVSPLIQPISVSPGKGNRSPGVVLSSAPAGGLLARRGKLLSLDVSNHILTPESPLGDFPAFVPNASSEGGAGIQLSDLAVIDKLGEGSQGSVMKMRHTTTGQLVACKTIRVDTTTGEDAPRRRQQLRTEVQTYTQARSKHIVRCHGCFMEEGMVQIVLEYMDCGSLEEVLKKSGPWEESLIAVLAVQLTSGLQYLHEARTTVHRDLKPANILLNTDGEAKLSDFGVSKGLTEPFAKCDTFVGTFCYMSPERIDTSRSPFGYDFATDIWALGLILVECALGRYPFPDNLQVFEFMQVVCEQDAPIDEWFPNDAAVSADFKDFVGQCLRLEATRRPSAAELLHHPFLAPARQDPAALDLAFFLRDTMMFEPSS